MSEIKRINSSNSAAKHTEVQTAGRKRKLTCENPAEYVVSAFTENGFDVKEVSTIMADSYLKPTKEMVDAFTTDTIKPVRDENLAKLKELHEAGVVLECCNRFGESLIHMACRRGCTDIVRFLVNEANVSLKIRDDYGRTPLHDACWTSVPKFDLVEFVIQECPELLCTEDIRGHAPLNYVRKEHWGKWIDFLEQRKHMFRPKIVIGAISTSG